MVECPDHAADQDRAAKRRDPCKVLHQQAAPAKLLSKCKHAADGEPSDDTRRNCQCKDRRVGLIPNMLAPALVGTSPATPASPVSHAIP
jgi:hypothetical protein